MSDFKFTMLCNTLIDITVAVCVTVVAVYFGKPSMCWWYLLLLGTGFSYRRD